jgi:tRNA threonylcarbamoyladenosine biosynthesis protein TsaE
MGRIVNPLARAVNYVSHSESETVALGREFGLTLSPNSIICFFGDLGAGKTTFIKGLAESVLGESVSVNSPTFVYLNIYKGKKPPTAVYHFDLYRLHDSDDFLGMGFDELFYAGGVCCIEWSERIAAILPPHCIQVTMSYDIPEGSIQQGSIQNDNIEMGNIESSHRRKMSILKPA